MRVIARACWIILIVGGVGLVVTDLLLSSNRYFAIEGGCLATLGTIQMVLFSEVERSQMQPTRRYWLMLGVGVIVIIVFLVFVSLSIANVIVFGVWPFQ